MQDEPNPVKDYLFDYLSKSDKKIQKLISDEKFSEIIDDVITNCYDKIITLGEKDECVSIIGLQTELIFAYIAEWILLKIKHNFSSYMQK